MRIPCTTNFQWNHKFPHLFLLKQLRNSNVVWFTRNSENVVRKSQKSDPSQENQGERTVRNELLGSVSIKRDLLLIFSLNNHNWKPHSWGISLEFFFHLFPSIAAALLSGQSNRLYTERPSGFILTGFFLNRNTFFCAALQFFSSSVYLHLKRNFWPAPKKRHKTLSKQRRYAPTLNIIGQ